MQSTQSYLNATQAKDWKSVLEMMNPKIFNYAPKAMLEQMYKQMENDSGMRFNYSEIEILRIKTEFILADTSYIPVDYSMTIQVHVNPKLYKNPDDIRLLHQGFEKTYAGQEVVFDPVNSRFSIDLKNTLIASSAQNSQLWYFSEYKANDPLLSYILPIEVMNRLLAGWN
ncbi:hypothetical protein [Algoriphagus mannitolivorans]|uniref:hypothetical protein n=1 Tax=Algoriphagus mannitolivorans TaxID=226504 RepID=UPI000406A95E|nr:hypothetical protein [Algoriphagus mannitolivorans]